VSWVVAHRVTQQRAGAAPLPSGARCTVWSRSTYATDGCTSLSSRRRRRSRERRRHFAAIPTARNAVVTSLWLRLAGPSVSASACTDGDADGGSASSRSIGSSEKSERELVSCDTMPCNTMPCDTVLPDTVARAACSCSCQRGVKTAAHSLCAHCASQSPSCVPRQVVIPHSASSCAHMGACVFLIMRRTTHNACEYA